MASSPISSSSKAFLRSTTSAPPSAGAPSSPDRQMAIASILASFVPATPVAFRAESPGDEGMKQDSPNEVIGLILKAGQD